MELLKSHIRLSIAPDLKLVESKKSILVTGAGGFIGFHLAKRLCEEGNTVIGIDNLNEYYDVKLKHDRVGILSKVEGFDFHQMDLGDAKGLYDLIAAKNIDCVVNLAAQAGVRYSLQNPQAYIDSNINGFLNILEASRKNTIGHLIFASSSSVYGANRKIPFSVDDNVDHPVSLYAATKKSNELMAHAYSSLYNLPVTGLRFFTVYGPYGRPDMALFLFTKAIFENKPINVFNNGDLRRDFTYIDDIIEGMIRLIPVIPGGDEHWNGAKPNPSSSYAPYRIYNIGNNQPVELMEFIRLIEKSVGKKAVLNMMPMQKGDVYETYANIDNLSAVTGFTPRTSIEEGITKFVNWYKDYYATELAQ